MRKNSGGIKGLLAIILAFMIIGGTAGIGYFTLTKGTVNNYEEYYNAVLQGIRNYDTTVVVKVRNYSKDVYNLDVVHDVLNKNQDLMGNFNAFNLKTRSNILSTEMNLTFEYYKSKEELVARDKAVDEKVTEIVAQVTNSNMEPYAKEKALHDYIINNCKFDTRYYSGDMPKESFTAYGALINGTAVCQGYALAIDKLFKKAGIETQIIVGDSYNEEKKIYEPHAWNLVKFEDKYYHLDVTWDDPVMKDGSDTIRYSYFNITDSEISANHKWDASAYPKCEDKKYSFENLNFTEKDDQGNVVTPVEDYKALATYIQQDVSTMKASSAYKIPNFDGDTDKILNIIEGTYEGYGKGGSFKVYHSTDEITKAGYITINYSYL